MILATNLTTIQNLYTFFNERRWEDLKGLYADNTLVLDTDDGTRYITCCKEDMGKRYATLGERYQDIKEHILYISESGDKVFVQYRTSFKTQAGNVHVETGWSIYTLEKGKIKKEAPYISYP